jgi:hypothetical protein
MDFILYLNCFIGGLLGLLFHLFAIKIPAAKKRAEAANIPFKLKEYFKDDYPAVIASLLTVVIFVYLLSELIGYNPSLLRTVKYFFLGVGYTGSSALISLLGKYDKGTLKIVDVKTNLSDGIDTKKP